MRIGKDPVRPSNAGGRGRGAGTGQGVVMRDSRIHRGSTPIRFRRDGFCEVVSRVAALPPRGPVPDSVSTSCKRCSRPRTDRGTVGGKFDGSAPREGVRRGVRRGRAEARWPGDAGHRGPALRRLSGRGAPLKGELRQGRIASCRRRLKARVGLCANVGAKWCGSQLGSPGSGRRVGGYGRGGIAVVWRRSGPVVLPCIGGARRYHGSCGERPASGEEGRVQPGWVAAR